jgi:hypothetical protein
LNFAQQSIPHLRVHPVSSASIQYMRKETHRVFILKHTAIIQPASIYAEIIYNMKQAMKRVTREVFAIQALTLLDNVQEILLCLSQVDFRNRITMARTQQQRNGMGKR